MDGLDFHHYAEMVISGVVALVTWIGRRLIGTVDKLAEEKADKSEVSALGANMTVMTAQIERNRQEVSQRLDQVLNILLTKHS